MTKMLLRLWNNFKGGSVAECGVPPLPPIEGIKVKLKIVFSPQKTQLQKFHVSLEKSFTVLPALLFKV